MKINFLKNVNNLTRQTTIVSAHEVVAFYFRYGSEVVLPEIRKHVTGPLLIKPDQFLSTQGEDTPEDQGLDPTRVGLRIG